MDRRDIGRVDRLGGTGQRVVHLDALRIHEREERALRIVPCRERDGGVERQDDAPAQFAGAGMGAGVNQIGGFPRERLDRELYFLRSVVAAVDVAGQ